MRIENEKLQMKNEELKTIAPQGPADANEK